MSHERGKKVKQEITKGAENKAAESHGVLHDLHDMVKKDAAPVSISQSSPLFLLQQQHSLIQTMTFSGPQEHSQHSQEMWPQGNRMGRKNQNSDKGWLEKKTES